MSRLLLLAVISLSAPCGAAEPEPAKAVVLSPQDGIKLSAAAEKTIGLKTAPAPVGAPQRVPLDALVYFHRERLTARGRYLLWTTAVFALLGCEFLNHRQALGERNI